MKAALPPMDFARRLSGLQERMAELGLDIVVYGLSPDFSYLTGIALDHVTHGKAERGDEGAGVLFVPREGSPVLTVSEALAERASRSWIADVRTGKGAGEGAFARGTLSDLGVEAGLVGLVGLGGRVDEDTAKEIARAAPGAGLRDAKGLLDHLRMIKDTGEIERLRRVAELTGKALAAVLPAIREGVTQGELEDEVAHQGRRLGASGVSFKPAALFVEPGSEAGPDPFIYPREKGLVPGASIAFDMGFTMDGYASDFGRSFCFRPAGDEVREGYRALNDAVLETVGAMRDGGVMLRELFPALERTLDRLGYGDYLRARLPTGVLGHSIGVEVHEHPWIGPDCEGPVRANMVLALEPKLWHAGEYYLRVEDVVLVGERETEFLTSFDREVFEI